MKDEVLSSAGAQTNRKGSCQLVSFVLKTDYIHIKISYMDERPCMSKQLKWNNFPHQGDTLSVKINRVVQFVQTACLRKSIKWNIFSRQGERLSGKISQVEQIPLIKRQLV